MREDIFSEIIVKKVTSLRPTQKQWYLRTKEYIHEISIGTLGKMRRRRLPHSTICGLYAR